MAVRTNLEWEAWGERDPLWGVASWTGREKKGGKPWTDSEFYALGDDWFDFLEPWKGYGLTPGTCLEIGCGAGRMTQRLAQTFSTVIAADVSKGMLDYAQAHVTESNIAWALSNGEKLPCSDAAVDAVFSCHVFQHLPDTATGHAYFIEIKRALKSGGSFLVHLPVHNFPDLHLFPRIARPLHSALTKVSDVRNGARRLLMQFGGSPPMNLVSYEQKQLAEALMSMGFARVQYATFLVRAGQGLHTCVLGTKP